MNEIAKFYRDGLLGDVIPFWLRHAVDDELGGIMTSVDRDGARLDTDKFVWQQGRFAWLLGELYNNVEKNPQWLEIAKQTLDFLDRFGFDPHDGRMWFHLTRDGQPIRKRRYAFSESFAAIAYGEMALATGSDRHATVAKNCFERFVTHSQNRQPTSSKFTNTRPSKSIAFPVITLNAAQELRDSIGLDNANEWIDRSIEEIRNDFVRPEIECVMETVSLDGELIDHFEGRALNPGHAIEAAWFIMQEGSVRADHDLVKLGCQMLEWMWQRGWDEKFGGLFYFASVDGKPLQEYWHDMKFWWPHNEAIIATLLAFQLTGDDKYLGWHKKICAWSYQHFADLEHGEWYGYLHRDGTVSNGSKGNMWKGPFHLPRMQLICWRLWANQNALEPGKFDD